MQVQEFCDASHIARRLGVKWNDVMKWADRPTASFPLPVAVLRLEVGKDKPLWAVEQLPKLRAWVATRLNLSDPESHWALIDCGGEQPGGHQDQMEMFSTGQVKAEAEPDGLFSLEGGAA